MANESNPENGLILDAIDIYVGAMDVVNPEDIETAYAAEWLQCGIIDGDDGVEESRDWGKDDDFYGLGPAGSILVASVKAQFKLTRSFNFLEDNDATRSLLWPGSTETTLKVPRSQKLKLGMDFWYQNGRKERLITVQHAMIDVAGYTINQDLTKFPATATIYPNAAGELFDRQTSELVVGA